LDETESFPIGEFLNATVLAVLQVLGLQSAITPSVLIDIARSLANASANNTKDPAFISQRAKALLTYIDANVSKFLDPKPPKGSYLQ
jgi:hypothetical protein